MSLRLRKSVKYTPQQITDIFLANHLPLSPDTFDVFYNLKKMEETIGKAMDSHSDYIERSNKIKTELETLLASEKAKKEGRDKTLIKAASDNIKALTDRVNIYSKRLEKLMSLRMWISNNI
jgi:hypothetical protein